VSALNLSEMAKKWLRTFMPLIAFGVVMFFTWMAGYNIVPLKWYFLCVFVQMFAFFVSKDKPAFTLLIFGILGTLATIVGLMNTGNIGIYAFLSAGLFLSIMWPCIFSLSVAGLGKYQSQGAGFLVMMILGGAILPPIQGKLADIIGIHESFFIATIAFLYLTYFAYFVKKSLRKQGIEFDQKIEGGH
jgi:FHS family L-fucose permease-like MFS transporter